MGEVPGPSWSAISGSLVGWGGCWHRRQRCVTRSIVPGVTSASVHQSTHTPPLLIVNVSFYPSEPKGVMASSQKLRGQQESLRQRNVGDNANLSRSDMRGTVDLKLGKETALSSRRIQCYQNKKLGPSNGDL